MLWLSLFIIWFHAIIHQISASYSYFQKPTVLWLLFSFSIIIIDENLSRVLNGSTQNPNESYHSVLWSMAPKSRCSSGTIIDFCVALSTIVYNDGFQSLLPLFDSLLGMKSKNYKNSLCTKF